MKSITSFAWLATDLGINRCIDCDQFDHQKGGAEPSRGTVHWAEHRVTRSTLRTFLKLVGSIVHSHNRGQPLWVRLYEQNTYATKTALTYGIRIPKRYADLDRAMAMDAMYRSRRSTPDQNLRRWIRDRET